MSVMGWISVTAAEPRHDDDILQSLQKEALPDLIQSLTEKKNAKHLRIVRVAGDVQDHRASQLLVDAYEKNKDEGVRYKILESLGRLRDPSLLKWLERRLEDPHIGIQCFAIWALGELKSPAAAEALRQKLWASNRFVQITAIDAIGKIGKNASVAAQLEVFLRDDDVQVRYLAAKALGGAATPESAPELAQRLAEEPSAEVQEVLAVTLGRTGGEVGVGRLIELLKYSPSPATEHYAELGLAVAERENLVPALKPLLEGDDFRLKVAAARILNEKDHEASKP